MKRRSLAMLVALAMAFSLAPAGASADETCGDSFTPIHDIQGDGSFSPVDGDVITTEGVVTVDVQRTDQQRGFFLESLDDDGNAATSEGIFVFQQDTWSGGVFDVSVGEVIRITAEVDEFFGLTQLRSVDDIIWCGTERVSPTNLTVKKFNATPEAYEGMFVQFSGNLSVTDTFNLHRFGEVWLGDVAVIEQPTNKYPGGSAQMFAFADANMANSLLLDDASRFSNPDPVPFLTDEETLRLGDRTRSLRGAISYAFGNYRVWSDEPVVFTTRKPRPESVNVDGELLVASFNVLNYWTTLGGRGAEDADQLAVQTEKLVAAIIGMGADIVGLQEIENDPECGDLDPLTICDHTPTETLVAALNAEEGAGTWAWVGPVNHYNQYPIRNEIIYRTASVSPMGVPVALADPAFDTFRDEDLDSQLGRPPIAQAFEAGGEVFTVVVNHFKSKGSPCAVIGDPDTGDGQGNCNGTRVAQAEAVLDWLPDLVAASGDDDILVIGDLNAYFAEDPVVTLESELVNVLGLYDENPYSFNFFASFAAPFIGRGTLDHALATSSMAAQVEDVKIWHINADEPRFLDWFDTSRVAPGPYRSSDHDPVLIGVSLDS